MGVQPIPVVERVMARIRTIKPEFFTSEDVVSLSAFARLLYIALWCEADREGRMRWKPATFKMRYFPADAVDIDGLCAEVVNRGLVRLYGDGYAVIPTFTDHQHVNPRESKSLLPVPEFIDLHASVTRDDASLTHREEGKEGKEGKERKEAPADPGGSSLSQDFDSPASHAPPDPNGSAGPSHAAESDPVKEIFDLGVSILTRSGHPERSARTLIGRLRKLRTDEEAASILVAAKATTDPAAYIVKATQPKPRRVQLC